MIIFSPNSPVQVDYAFFKSAAGVGDEFMVLFQPEGEDMPGIFAEGAANRIAQGRAAAAAGGGP